MGFGPLRRAPEIDRHQLAVRALEEAGIAGIRRITIPGLVIPTQHLFIAPGFPFVLAVFGQQEQPAAIRVDTAEPSIRQLDHGRGIPILEPGLTDLGNERPSPSIIQRLIAINPADVIVYVLAQVPSADGGNQFVTGYPYRRGHDRPIGVLE